MVIGFTLPFILSSGSHDASSAEEISSASNNSNIINISTIVHTNKPVILEISQKKRSGLETVLEKEYNSILEDISKQRERFKKSYVEADKSEKKEVIKKAREYIFSSMVEKIFPAWYGTPWAFYGTTEMPGQGKIACGYFVTTTLRDAGFDLPRIALAQQASEHIIRNLTDNVRTYSNKDINYIKKEMNDFGQGLYIVGLDNHVGFIVNNGKDTRFVHSSYYLPEQGVMSEPIDSLNPLKDSKYRVIGKIMDDDMVRKWIFNEKFQIKYSLKNKK